MSDSLAPTVTIDCGRLRGLRVQAASSLVPLHAYLGVPYAKPPLGELRWRPPQSIGPWEGVRPANCLGNNCAQRPEAFDSAPVRGAFSEDCLTLNVWAPADPVADRRAVMVWIHGGGFVSGGSSPLRYDGAALAARGVVVVTVNYRLGRFGFFAHPALRRTAGDDSVGNFGLMDQMAALHWVQRNVAAFGGDPNRVTLFGESAGGASIAWLMASSAAHGLFQQAIIQSAPLRNNDPLGRRTYRLGDEADDAPALARDWARNAGVPAGNDASTLSALRGLPVETLTEGLALMGGGACDFTGPIAGGPIWPYSPEDAAQLGCMLRIPVLLGSNSDELGFLDSPMLAARQPAAGAVLSAFGAQSGVVAMAYADELKAGGARFVATLRSDQVFVEPTRFMARALAPHQPVYVYRFAHGGPGGGGALHASELPYVFETLATLPGAGEAEHSLASYIADTWVAFAQTGVPERQGGVAWPRWHGGAEKLMWLDGDGAAPRDDPATQRLDTVAA